MKNFVGIDLGTTNSAICSYNGAETRIWKSPEQNDVTPSAIYIDKRGNKYVGKRAYDAAPHNPDSSAMLFKRLMGTSTPIELAAVNLSKTPEECSAEVLKVLFGYLPEEIRNDADTGTVITVPAAFNQMQKNATMQAASMAGIGKVALMQEPVAAVMSVMRASDANGMFLIYDLGGGTLDLAIAQSINKRVNLLSHGGIAMCGGRDFDRVLLDNVVLPWLMDNFNLPDDIGINPKFKALMRLSAWAAERAKIELSANEEAVISLAESEARVCDLSDNEVYIDIPLKRASFDKLIEARVNESLAATRDALADAGIAPHDLSRIVFVGGPTNYKPLRDKIAFELGVPADTDVNPMTAVAEGASLFAESIDWSKQDRRRKSNRGRISSGGKLDIAFNYIARTPNIKSKIAVKIGGKVESGSEFQVDSVDTGWTSGRMQLCNDAVVEVNLHNYGDNSFKVFVFDPAGGPVKIEQDKITITRTAASIDAIPCSHSIAIEVLQKVGGSSTLDYLVRAGDSLPHKGSKTFKAAESLKAGSPGSINIKLWEGEIENPVTDNRPIGVLKISGADFDDGVIPAGADLECEYEILDSGNIMIEVAVPCIGGIFNSGKNFYSRQEGQLDYTNAADRVANEGKATLRNIEEINRVVDSPKVDQARQKVESAIALDTEKSDIEQSQQAMEQVYEARKLLAQVRKEHLKEIRQLELDKAVVVFEQMAREYARDSEIKSFETLVKTAQLAIDRNSDDFEHYLQELNSKSFAIVGKQDWFVVEMFKSMLNEADMFTDRELYMQLAASGMQFLRDDNIEQLRLVVGKLAQIRIGEFNDSGMLDMVNILRG